MTHHSEQARTTPSSAVLDAASTAWVEGLSCEGPERETSIDVLEPVLEMAVARTASAGLARRIQLRLQSIADLAESNCYDLAWMPQAYIARSHVTEHGAGEQCLLLARRPA